ncbi:MAG: hypothetical protein A2096_12355 [Spirochaetes bacterium GWF1_41_5]|nr:MAG: hypothetical protein A2096_12355 [Spirochaetes bacterium GWF1_41_5]
MFIRSLSILHAIIFFIINTIANAESLRETIVFNADIHSAADIVCRTMPGPHAGDYIPIAEPVIVSNEKMIKFLFSGSTGGAQANFFIERFVQKNVLDKNYTGIGFEFFYEKEDLPKFQVRANFTDKTIITGSITLEKGLRKYIFNKGFRKEPAKPDWNNTYIIGLVPEAQLGHNFVVYLKKIYLVYREEDPSDLRIIRRRKTYEALLLTDNIKTDGIRDNSEWNAAAVLGDYFYHTSGEPVSAQDSPLAVKIGYYQDKLHIGISSDFPSAPLSIMKKNDEAIWQDEAFELFFNAELDNNKYIQFAVNAAGTVFDSIREFDQTDVAVVNKKDWNLFHEKTMQYKAGRWSSELSISMKDIKLDFNKYRFITFQAAQNYKSRNGKHQTLSWEKTAKFPDPYNFGIIVFNKNSFGSGEIFVSSIKRKNLKDHKADYKVSTVFTGFISGNYKTRIIITAKNGDIFSVSEKIDIAGTNEKKDFYFSGINNLNGIYSLFVEVANKDGDLRLAGINFENPVQTENYWGRKIFCPKPKNITWRSEIFLAGRADYLYIDKIASPRTIRTAEIFIDRYFKWTGKKLSLTNSRVFSENTAEHIIFIIKSNFIHNGKNINLPEQGYMLEINPDKVIMVGADEEGLFYAGITFFQLINHKMDYQENCPVPSLEIIDWPDLKYRGAQNRFFAKYGPEPYQDPYKPEILTEWTEKNLIRHKLNFLNLGMFRLVKYRRMPDLNCVDTPPFTLDDIQVFSRFCRDNFIQIIPLLQTVGHMDQWLLRDHPDLREKGWKATANLADPKMLEYVKLTAQDWIDAVKPEYFLICNDEAWHYRQEGETPEDKLAGGKPHNELFIDFTLKMYEFLKNQNIAMMTYSTMLSPYHNGKRKDIYLLVDQLPKDIIIVPWLEAREEWFMQKGFNRFWVMSTGFQPFNGIRDKIMGFSGNWNSGHTTLTDLEKSIQDKIQRQACIYRSSEYSWNLKNDDGRDTIDYIESGFLGAIMQMAAVNPNPAAGSLTEVVDISKQMNTSLKKFLLQSEPDRFKESSDPVRWPEREMTIGNIKMKLYGGGNNDCIMPAPPNGSLSIIVEKKYSSLIFLHAVYADREKSGMFKKNWRVWPQGYPAGEYIIQYADGTAEKLPIRMFNNINNIRLGLDYKRYGQNIRYIHIEKDINNDDLLLHQWEWNNPRPELLIKNIIYTHNPQVDLKSLLFSLSGRNIK